MSSSARNVRFEVVWRLASALAIALISSACGLLPRATPHPGVACEQVYSETDCIAMVELAATHLGMGPDDIVAIAIAPAPSPPPGSTPGAAAPIRIRLKLLDGSTLEGTICGGVSREPICDAQPRGIPPE
jgi:hypothetical protein